jgi:hypothetical protein
LAVKRREEARALSLISALPFGCTTTMATGCLISLGEPAPAREQLEGLIWSRQQSLVEPAEQTV